LELAAVKTSYRYWAPIYDYTFGRITGRGRRRTVDYINRRAGRVLEIGVGTGLSLDRYATHLQVTGIDVSADMLDKARRKVAERKLAHVVRISEMDARTLAFPDGHFDTVVAMHVISVVPEPEKVMEEMARVCKPGGFLAALERLFAPLANVIGWHSDFELGRILGVRSLEVTRTMPMPPFGIFTFLIQRKAEAARAAA